MAPKFSSYRTFLDASADDLTKLSFKPTALERWRKHRLALRLTDSKPLDSCPTWLELSQDVKYPLAKLAALHWDLICAAGTPAQTLELSADEKNIYDPILNEKALKESEKTAAPEDDVEALNDKARSLTHYQDREEYFKKALAKARESKNPKLIAGAEAALYKNSPRLNPQPKKSEWMNVAIDFRTWREFDPALKIYRRIVKDPASDGDEIFSALKGIRQTLKTAERRNDYIEATAEMARWTYLNWKQFPRDAGVQKRFHDSQLLLVRTFWTEDRTNDAIKTLKRTERWLAGVYPLDELNFIRSRIFEERKDHEAALNYLKKALAEKSSQKNLREKMLWAEAWILYKNEKYEDVLAPLKELTDRSQDNPEKAKAYYWMSRSLIKMGKTDQAKEMLASVIKEDPLGFYGLLALREMGMKIAPIDLNSGSEVDERLSAAKTPKELKNLSTLTDWLVAVNEVPFAERSLNRFAEHLRKFNSTEDDLWLKVFGRYAQAGSYLPLFSMLTQVKSEVRESLLKSHPEILFPEPFHELVQRKADDAKVPPELVYAIMRQESAFNPKARSPADAYGLMQLIPTIAKVRAQQKSVPFAKATDLYDPETNITLGAFELQALLNKYDQQFIMAIAAYNASDKALKGWLKLRYRLDPLEFIEEIPYEETRAYIKLVLRNYIFYLRLNANEPFDFPESCLKLDQSPAAASYLETK